MVYRYRHSKNQEESAPERKAQEHISPSGFTWTLTLPERTAAPMGQRKPLATISCEGYEDLHVPVPVAKALSAPDAPVSDSHAELLYNVREMADKLAYQKVIDLVSRREYSSQEAQDKLRLYGYSRECSARVVARAQEARIINNARFTESFIRSKIYAGWGPIKIERELALRGVEASSLPGWPDAYFEAESVSERARELLSTKSIPSKNAYQKLVRFLVSKGYSMSVAKDAVLARLADIDTDVCM